MDVMCGCGIDRVCFGCTCGCTHGTRIGIRRQVERLEAATADLVRERDAERERFAALVADLRALCEKPRPGGWDGPVRTEAHLLRDGLLAVIDRHAPGTTTEEGR